MMMDIFDEEEEDDYMDNNYGIRLQAKDVYGDLYGTPFFKNWCGLSFGGFIQPLTDTQKVMNQGIFQSSSTAYQILDGSMYKRRRTQNLRDGYARRDYYDWKNNWAESVKCLYYI